MSNEPQQAELELKEPQRDTAPGPQEGPPGPEPGPEPVPAPGPAGPAGPAAADTDATEADVSEADLDPDLDADLDPEAQEKVPMTAAGPQTGSAAAAAAGAGGDTAETNGAVKLKIPDEDEPREPEHFTGLNKEELMRVAGTPGWVRVRWSLLVLFWLSWLGMLAGAVLLILKAPPCKELPTLNWWNQGPLFQIRRIQDFSPSANIKGVEQSLDSLVQMKVQGLVLGPVHPDPKDDVMSLSFEEVSAEVGSLDQVKSLLQAAHQRGVFVVLDLTPNFSGSSGAWFGNSSVSSVADRLKSALVFWLTLGVDGVKLDSVDSVWTWVPSQWSDLRAIVQNWTDSRPHKRLLLGTTSLSSPQDVSSLLSDSGLDLVLAPVLGSDSDPTERAQTAVLLSSAHSPTQLLWSVWPAEGARTGCDHMELLLLLSLPGTALIQDQGLDQDRSKDKVPRILQDSDQEQNRTEQLLPPALLCPALSPLVSLRTKERSLLFGDFSLVYNSSSALVFLRSWDQSPKILVLLNYSPDRVLSLSETVPGLLGPPGTGVKLLLSSNGTEPGPDRDLELGQVQVGPKEGLMLKI